MDSGLNGNITKPDVIKRRFVLLTTGTNMPEDEIQYVDKSSLFVHRNALYECFKCRRGITAESQENNNTSFSLAIKSLSLYMCCHNKCPN